MSAIFKCGETTSPGRAARASCLKGATARSGAQHGAQRTPEGSDPGGPGAKRPSAGNAIGAAGDAPKKKASAFTLAL